MVEVNGFRIVSLTEEDMLQVMHIVKITGVLTLASRNKGRLLKGQYLVDDVSKTIYVNEEDYLLMKDSQENNNDCK